MIEVDKEFQSRIEEAGDNKVLVKAIKTARELALKGMVEQIKVVNIATQKVKSADVAENGKVEPIIEEIHDNDTVTPADEMPEDVDSETGHADGVSVDEDAAPVNGQEESTLENQTEDNDLETVDVSNGTTAHDDKGQGESATIPVMSESDAAYINADMQKEKAEDLQNTGTFNDKAWDI